ncbi:hypothetical protein Csa_022882 [Cucumis sativus]|nr:hypothetical protein Csa_022882 [Cucumis sativus]
MVESRPDPKTSLATRLKLDSETSDCWGTLHELQACTGEVVTFFLTGETYLGSNCCQAIKVIQHECWPTLLASLGYTTEEALIKDPTIVKLLKSFNTSVGQHYLNRDILEVYCDTSIDAAFTTSSSPLA